MNLPLIPGALAASVPNLCNSLNIVYVHALCEGIALRCFPQESNPGGYPTSMHNGLHIFSRSHILSVCTHLRLL